MGDSCRQGSLTAGTSQKSKRGPGQKTIRRTRAECLFWGAPAALPRPPPSSRAPSGRHLAVGRGRQRAGEGRHLAALAGAR